MLVWMFRMNSGPFWDDQNQKHCYNCFLCNLQTSSAVVMLTFIKFVGFIIIFFSACSELYLLYIPVKTIWKSNLKFRRCKRTNKQKRKKSRTENISKHYWFVFYYSSLTTPYLIFLFCFNVQIHSQIQWFNFKYFRW